MDQKIQIGDVVTLKSQPKFPMTVIEVSDAVKPLAKVIYELNGAIVQPRDPIPIVALRIAE